jgi:hypothetical protein
MVALSMVGIVIVAAEITAQTQKNQKPITITVQRGVHPIAVNKSGKCITPHVLHVAEDDTITWDGSAAGVRDFHIIFPVSPFKNGQTFFDKANSSSGAIKKSPSGTADVFKYVIAVDGAATCDPHVIIMGARDDQAREKKD